MHRFALPAALLALIVIPSITLAQLVEPRAGMVVTASTRFRPGVYRLAAPASLDSAAIVVRGDDVTVDMDSVVIEGIDPSADPDGAGGVAIRVDGGHNVKIRNATIRGFKVAVLASGTHGLELSGNDLSYNWKPRLYSLVEHESLVDWLSYHHNEKDEWLRYGAAAYLRDVHGGEIRDNHAEQGMNGLMLVRSDSLRVWNNSFSFNSGLGIGLYRSSDNRIMHNRVDYDVRGYSHGYYRRGQDSAALLLYEQSCRNVVAYNSMTHGGDGLFLWAGQSTMDTGEGGANDNLFYGNDFSFAPTNGMEATFSRNRFVNNRIEGSDNGFWGGYSYGSLVVGNRFIRNRVGIAVEHGQNDTIAGNRFDGDSTAVSLWANPIEPSDWGYPKHRDTKSHGWSITQNVFDSVRVALRAANTTDLTFRGNLVAHADTTFVLRDTASFRDEGTTSHASIAPLSPWVSDSMTRWAPDPLPGGLSANAAVASRPRSSIVVDEWGPYDFRSPKLWPIDSVRATPLRLQVLGPSGRWHVVGTRGVKSVSKQEGAMPDTIAVVPDGSAGTDWEILLEFQGGPTRSPRGDDRPAGTPVRFSYGRFEPTIAWSARFVTWGDSTDPTKHPAAFDALFSAHAPLYTATLPRLDLEWYRPTIGALPLEHWAMDATGTVTLDAPATYTLRAISDDGIRVWVDGRLAIDHWAAHESAVDEATIAPGTHALRVQYYQVDGWTEMRVEIVKR